MHAFATTVNYTINPTTFLEGTYGYSNRRLGGVVNSDFTNRFNTGLQELPSLYRDAYAIPEGSYNRRVMEDVAPPFFLNGRAELAPTFQWGTRVGTPPPNLPYPAFLNTNPTQDISVSLTKILGSHTAKVGFYSNHSLKQQNLNQRNALPFQGDLSFANVLVLKSIGGNSQLPTSNSQRAVVRMAGLGSWELEVGSCQEPVIRS